MAQPARPHGPDLRRRSRARQPVNGDWPDRLVVPVRQRQVTTDAFPRGPYLRVVPD
jgi:hypothetical protein